MNAFVSGGVIPHAKRGTETDAYVRLPSVFWCYLCSVPNTRVIWISVYTD